MNIKQYLQQYQLLSESILYKTEELKEIERDCIMPNGISYDIPRARGTKDNDAILKTIERMDKRKGKLIDEIRIMKKKQWHIVDQVYKVNDFMLYQILYLYYIKNVKPLDKVAEEIGRSADFVKHKHRDALKEMARIVEQEEREKLHRCNE